MRERLRGGAVRWLTPLLLLPPLGGCAPSLFELPETDAPAARYELSSPTFDEPACEPGAPLRIVLIERPTPRASLADAHIVVRSPTGELRALAGARWASAVPSMIQDLLRASLQSSCLHASESSLGLDRGYVLSTQLGQFHVVEDESGTSSVRVEITARLLARSPRRLAGTAHFSAEEAIEQTDVAAVVAAFDAASLRVAKALRRWTLETLAGESKEER